MDDQQFSPKLKEVMAEIKAILLKNDIAGAVALHTPGHGEFLLHVTPTYSCAWLEPGGMRMKAKASEVGGPEKRDQLLKDTTNMFHSLSVTVGQMAMTLIDCSETIDNTLGATHT